MRGGFRPLINEGCRVSEVDLDASRRERQYLAEQVRLRQHLVRLVDAVDECGSFIHIDAGPG